MKKRFKVTITETLEKDIFIEAVDETDAEILAEQSWCEGNHVLGADEFSDIKFKAVVCPMRKKEKDYER